MSETIVAKFGGTSMAQPEVVAELVEASRDNYKAIVVSAPGKSPGVNEKMTDQLIACAVATNRRDIDSIRDGVIDRFDSLYGCLGGIDRAELRDELKEDFDTGLLLEGKLREAHIAAIGERGSALYFSRLMGAEFVEPTPLKFTLGGRFLRDVSIDWVAGSLQSSWADKKMPIIPGFYGFDSGGNRRVLPRGGSDRTGGIISRGLGKVIGDDRVRYENRTDQLGIYSADPRHIHNAVLLDEVTRAEVREGAHGGSGILQGDTVVDLNGSNILTIVCSTFDVSAPGTRVVRERVTDPLHPVVAVSQKSLPTLVVDDMGMANEKGYLNDVLEVVRHHGWSVEHLPAAQDAFTLTLRPDDESGELEDCATALRERLAESWSSNAQIRVEDKSVVYLVGEALRNPLIHTRVIGQAAMRLADSDIGFDAIVSHPGSPSAALLMGSQLGQQAQYLLHEQFIAA